MRGGHCQERSLLACSVIALLLLVTVAVGITTDSENGESPSKSGYDHGIMDSESNYTYAIGDGHMHSTYSDGATTVHENSNVAKSRNLSWIVVTDHNVVPPQSVCDAESTGEFRCVIGEEVTTADGHILGWGLRELVPWNLGPDRNMNDIFEDIRVQGGLAIIAHPLAPDPPDQYQHFGVYENFDGLEVYHGYAGFNAAFPTTMDIDALSKWEEYLNAGIRKIAVGDSDCHDGNNDWDQGDLLNMRGAIGFPRNVALVKELSREGILEAVSKGRLYFTDGPILNFTIDGHILGETIRSSAPSTLSANVSGYANESSEVRLIRNGSVIRSWSVGAGWFSFSESTDADSDYWYRTEIRTFNGGLLRGETYVAFSNPIFFDLQPYDLPPASPSNLMAELRGSDVFLSWEASPSADVDRYSIYIADSYDNFSFFYPAARTVGTNWTQKGVGIGNNEDLFYIVRAVDRMGNEDNNTRKAAKTSRFLGSGKHLISFPLVTSDSSLKAILQTVEFDMVRTYDTMEHPSEWVAFHSHKGYSELGFMTNMKGYWVNVTQDSFFILAGAVPEETVIELQEGWNLVSYPAFINTTYIELTASLPVRRAECPSSNPPYYLRRMSPADDLTAFQGYWFEMSTNATWAVSG